MKDRPTIAIVAHDVGGQGGMERHLEELITRLRNDLDIIVVACTMNMADTGGVRFVRIPSVSRPASLKMVFFALLASIRLLVLKYDILHTTGAIVFNHADFSTVHFCHAGYVNATDGIRVRKASSLFRKLNSHVATTISIWMEKTIYNPRRTSQLIAVSKRVKNELISHFPYKETEVIVIPNGVHMEKFGTYSIEQKRHSRMAYKLSQSGTYLLFVGGDWERKGLHLVIAVFNLLAHDYPNLFLLIVGKGDARAYGKMVDASLSSRVYFVGMQDHPEQWMGMSDILIFPSSYETFSLVVHEAAASELVIFSTAVGGVEDFIEDSVNGFFIRPQVEDISTRLRPVIDDLSSYRIIGQRARKTVQQLTWENSYERFKDLYFRNAKLV